MKKRMLLFPSIGHQKILQNRCDAMVFRSLLTLSHYTVTLGFTLSTPHCKGKNKGRKI